MDISLLRSWININSGSLHQEGLARMATALSEAFASLPGTLEIHHSEPYQDLDDKWIHPGDTLRFRFNQDAPVQVLLSGHMDTVFAPDHPFQSWREDDDCLYGPGVADMKGGLFILFSALQQFLQSNPKNVGGYVLINGDEEIGSPGSAGLLRETARQCQFGLVFESSLPDGALVHQRKGTATLRILAKGRSAHTGRDFANGRNALVAMADLVTACHALNDTFPEALLNVGALHSGGPVNVVPDAAEAWINIRTDKSDSIDLMTREIENRIATTEKKYADISFSIRTGAIRLPRNESRAESVLHENWNTIETHLGFEISGKRATGGTSDGNIFAEVGLPHLDGVGVRGGHIHSDQEFCFKESIPAQIAKTVAFLQHFEKQP
jgi:glutamate carboxypeptidase